MAEATQNVGVKVGGAVFSTPDANKELPQKISVNVDAIIKAIRTGDVDRIVRHIYYAARVKLKSRAFRKCGHATMDVTQAVKSTPTTGSDNVNVFGVLRWIEDVKVDDENACKDLVKVWGTCAERLA